VYGLAVSSRADLCYVQIIHDVKQVQYVEPQEDHIFFSHYYLCKSSTLDVDVFGYNNLILRNVLPKYGRFLLVRSVQCLCWIGQ